MLTETRSTAFCVRGSFCENVLLECKRIYKRTTRAMDLPSNFYVLPWLEPLSKEKCIQRNPCSDKLAGTVSVTSELFRLATDIAPNRSETRVTTASVLKQDPNTQKVGVYVPCIYTHARCELP